MKKLICSFAAFLMIIAASCTSIKEEKETVFTIKVDTVQSINNYKQSVSFPGKVKAASDVSLAFRVAGTIQRMNVDAGIRVRKGEVLAELDARDYETQLLATEAEYNRIKGEAERIIELYKSESVTPNDYDKAVYGLQQISAKLEAHRNALADTKLRAPFDGYIQKRIFTQNETIGAGMPVIAMISATVPEVEINIPSVDYVKRNQFDYFTCTVDIFPEKVFTLEFLGLNQKANLNQLYTTRFRIKEPMGELPTPGMTTMVTIHYQPNSSSYVKVPLSAIFQVKGAAHVWLYKKDTQTVSARRVKVHEFMRDGQVIIEEGVADGEVVVSAGVNSLEEGGKVKLLAAPSATNVGGML